MNYQQFVVVIKEKVALSLGSGIDLQICTTLKNNGKERIGLSISDQHVNIYPTIYLEEYYKQFQNGHSVDLIAKSIVDVYHEVKFEHTWKVDCIKNFSFIKSKITYKLIHAQKNNTLLKKIPHIPYLDLAIVFYILFDVDESGTATIPITNELLQLWEIDVNHLHQIAMENSPQLLPATFKPMRTVIAELMDESCDEFVQKDDIMFVLTNPLRTYGAACILYNGILEQIASQLGENFYILPSSIHETILIPESKSPIKEDLQEMVLEINTTQVDAEEVLSDSVYYYDFETRELRL